MAKVYRRPKLYPKQTAAFFNPLDAQGSPAWYSWIEGSTKSGKTVSCMAWLLEQAMLKGKPDREFWWVGPVSRIAKIAFNRIKRGLQITAEPARSHLGHPRLARADRRSGDVGSSPIATEFC
ncbi:hypothetical protein [Bradyrhizobium sp. SZCCHNPS2010]|uniref:hypothetical protein n=1 Tax=Bradyrhizobium sp. SZCCHNPS2010 TaxID=3057333 RepID=UPI0029160A20|nr:hypothetical protein [Bradyrhizobium sp. SZCCHNPS2010]